MCVYTYISLSAPQPYQSTHGEQTAPSTSGDPPRPMPTLTKILALRNRQQVQQQRMGNLPPCPMDVQHAPWCGTRTGGNAYWETLL